MGLPDFLKRENARPLSSEDEKFYKLLKEYRRMFGDSPMTEPSSYTDKEWIDMLSECLEERITIWELLGEEYDPDADY